MTDFVGEINCGTFCLRVRRNMCGFTITGYSANIIFKWKETRRLRILVEALSGITKFGINPFKAKVFLS